MDKPKITDHVFGMPEAIIDLSNRIVKLEFALSVEQGKLSEERFRRLEIKIGALQYKVIILIKAVSMILDRHSLDTETHHETWNDFREEIDRFMKGLREDASHEHGKN